jgi:hypothetical protein
MKSTFISLIDPGIESRVSLLFYSSEYLLVLELHALEFVGPLRFDLAPAFEPLCLSVAYR